MGRDSLTIGRHSPQETFVTRIELSTEQRTQVGRHGVQVCDGNRKSPEERSERVGC